MRPLSRVQGRAQTDVYKPCLSENVCGQGSTSPEDPRLSGRAERSIFATMTGSVQFLQHVRSHLRDMAICQRASIGEVGAR